MSAIYDDDAIYHVHCAVINLLQTVGQLYAESTVAKESINQALAQTVKELNQAQAIVSAKIAIGKAASGPSR